jgi:phosphatidate cytidylyltransferase
VLATRILTAVVLIPAVLAALFLLPPLGWGMVALAIVALGGLDWARLVVLPPAARVAFVAAIVAAGLTLLLTPAAQFGRGWPGANVFDLCGLASLFWIFVAPQWVVHRWPTQGKLAMAVVGLVVLLGAWMAIVQLQADSAWLVLAAMAIVWIADTATYFAGRAFGKRKLAPQVSPGKSWEGVYGAWVAVAIYALLLVRFAPAAGFRFEVTPVVVALWILFVVALASISVVGDLFESLLKRHAGVKDSGNVLPGHGGVLDRVDALIAAMPPAALAAHCFLSAR